MLQLPPKPVAAQPMPTVAAVQKADEVMELSSGESDDENDPGSIRPSEAELQALVEGKKKKRASVTA